MPRTPAVPRALGRLARSVLDRVRADRERGAHALAGEALGGLALELRSPAAGGPARELRKFARSVAVWLSRTQPAMAVFREWGREWADLAASVPDRALRTELRRWVRRQQRTLLREPGRLARVVQRRLPPDARIVTISRGATIARALRSLPAARRPREVVVLESRPGGEGRRMAEELRNAGLPARWVRDRSADRELRRASLVLVGADAIEPDGAVVHKVGTARLARKARSLGVPVVVLAGGSKRRRSGRSGHRLPPLFDRTPGSLVTEYWTDRGVVRAPRPPRDGSAHQREKGGPASRQPSGPARGRDRRQRGRP